MKPIYRIIRKSVTRRTYLIQENEPDVVSESDLLDNEYLVQRNDMPGGGFRTVGRYDTHEEALKPLKLTQEAAK
jgi:hypothetical protein